MRKFFFIILFLAICGNSFAQIESIEKEPIAEKTSDYWVYVRLEDRSGVTTADDAGRSKAGDVVAVLPVTPQNIPSETEKKEWMIYKTSLTETQRQEMLTTWIETDTKTETVSIPKEIYEDTAKKEAFLESIRAVSVTSAQAETKSYSVSAVVEYEKPIAYRKNKLDTSSLGVKVEKGLIPTKIDASKISVDLKTSADLSRYESKRKFYAYVQRPLKMVANKFIKPAFAETVSTINKTGEDYNTLTLWEDAVDGDLVTNTSQPTAECYDDDGELNDTSITIDGSTTNATYYMKITVPTGERHDGKKLSDGASGHGFVLERTTNTDTTKHLLIKDEYMVVEWIQMQGNGNKAEQAIQIEVTGINSYITISNVIIGNYVTNSGIRPYYGRYNTIKNFIIYNISGTTVSNGFGVDQRNTFNNTNYYNGTIYNIDADGMQIAGPAELKNVIVMGSNQEASSFVDFDCTGAVTTSANLSSDASAGTDCDDSNCAINKTASNQFVSITGGSEDFHLKTGSDAIDVGVDLSAIFTTDIDGVTRSGTWDIGADEYVSTETRRIIFIN